MKEASQVTACVIDHGLYLPLAFRLAKQYKRVLYWTPAERDFPTVPDCVIGDGYAEIERCQDFWPVKKEIDLFVFPDGQHGGLQLELESQGFAVWGSRRGDRIEMNRETFHRLLGEAGLEVPPMEVVVGLSTLRRHLRDKTDKYLKVSKYRGSFETFHWRDWTMDSGALDVWAVHFGPAGELVRFLVCDEIPTDLEIGGDTYCVNGDFPSKMVHGLEAKDKGYLGVATDTPEMPEQIRAAMEAFGPILGREGYRNLFSMEIRVQGDHFFFTDPCCRFPNPGFNSQMRLYTNFPEIVWGGANGELVEPEIADDYSVECGLTAKTEKGTWHVLDLDPEVREHASLRGNCQIDGHICIPPHESHGDEIGYLCVTGASLSDCIDKMKALVEKLPDGVSANTTALFDLLNEAMLAEEQGVLVSDDPLPEPATVLEGE